jgi:hypothetical protein
MAHTRATPRNPLLIRGARALARFVFGDERQWRAIYPLQEELGLIKVRGQLAGRPTTMERQIARRERASRRLKARPGRSRNAETLTR